MIRTTERGVEAVRSYDVAKRILYGKNLHDTTSSSRFEPRPDNRPFVVEH
jgi:hypothetical protein